MMYQGARSSLDNQFGGSGSNLQVQNVANMYSDQIEDLKTKVDQLSKERDETLSKF